MTKEAQITFRTEQETADKIDARCKGYEITRTDTIEADLHLFWNMLDIGMTGVERTFTREEMHLILDVLNGACIFTTSMQGGIRLWINSIGMEVSDGISLDKLDEKWGVDRNAIIKKIENTDRVERLAILDFAARFWRNPSDDLDEWTGKFKSGA